MTTAKDSAGTGTGKQINSKSERPGDGPTSPSAFPRPKAPVGRGTPTNLGTSIGRVEIVSVREVFAHEPINFATWLEDHIGAPAERLEMVLTVVQRESKVGEFNVDLLCEDGLGGR